jgi:hypothetical protein
LIVCEIELVNQLLVGGGFFQSMKVHTVQVLHDRLLERESIVYVVLEQYRYKLEFGDSGRAPSPFAGDEFVLVRFALHWSNDDGLKNTEFRN